MSHPYDSLPDHQYWRLAVGTRPPTALDPIVESPILIRAADRVATAGSCFAQSIAASLQAKGRSYYIEELAPPGFAKEEAQRRNFGVYSCRYGNIYTARQLLQLFRRSFGRFTPALDWWRRADGRFADPFRPQIEPDGFATVEALGLDREAQLAAVRRMFENLDVLVFTLGQTECWESRADGAVVPLAPGVAAGQFEESAYAFLNLKAGDTATDFLTFADELSDVNPKARLIVSLSPVPLVATQQRRHALVANAGNKAALRVAVDEIIAARPDIIYFPSYEIVTAACNAGRFFADDQRSVTPLGVAQVMRVFFRHFMEGGSPSGPARIDARYEATELGKVACDEEALDPFA
jgi:GSCFA family